jgi:hypothetical protein
VYAEAITLVYVYLAFNMIPYDELGKATLCQTEGFLYDTHAQPCGVVRWSILPGACSCAAKVLLSAAVACWW